MTLIVLLKWYISVLLMRSQKIHSKVKLLLLTVAARVMGKYGVSLPGFYMFIQRYMRPKQNQVTRIMAVARQSVHNNVPVEELQLCTKHIANEFVADACPPEVITVGLNTVSYSLQYLVALICFCSSIYGLNIWCFRFVKWPTAILELVRRNCSKIWSSIAKRGVTDRFGQLLLLYVIFTERKRLWHWSNG